MKSHNRLKFILQLAESQEHHAIRELGDAQRKKALLDDNLTQLFTFRDSYAEQFRSSGTRGMGASRLADYHAFLEKINRAIREQELKIKEAEAELGEKRQDWESAYRYVSGVAKLVEKTRKQEAAREQKRQQADTDERAGRRAGDDMLLPFLPNP